jgi:hypothetical protein
MISALYVRRDSIYKTLGVDCWDIDRDAKNKYDAIQYVITTNHTRKFKRVKKEVTKAEREETPEALARWMIAVAERCRIDHYDKTFR